MEMEDHILTLQLFKFQVPYDLNNSTDVRIYRESPPNEIERRSTSDSE